MTRNENIFIADRMLADMVQRIMLLEGIHVTYLQASSVLNNNRVLIRPSEAVHIIDLRRMWMHLLRNLDQELDCTWFEDKFELPNSVFEIENVVERAITMFIYIIASDFKKNIQNAHLVANFELIRHGAGLLTIWESDIELFNKQLAEYKENNDMAKFVQQITYHHYCDALDVVSAANRITLKEPEDFKF